MSIHKSLKTGSALSSHRNVLSRVERIKMLEEAGKWRETQNSVLGLPKVKSVKMKSKKKAEKKAEDAAATPAAAAAAPAAAAAAPAAKGAAKK